MLQRAEDFPEEISMRERRMAPHDSAEAARMMIEDLPVPAELATGLAALLHNLLATERLTGQCVDGVPALRPSANGAPKLIAFGMSGFLADDFAEDLIARPAANIAFEIVERCRDGRSRGLLDAGAVAKSNAGDGLTLLPFCWLQRPRERSNPLGAELAARGMQSFLAWHKGYNLKRILKEGARDESAALARAGLVRLKAFSGAEPASTSGRLLFGMTRQQALNDAYGSALSLLFSIRRPRLGFTRIQQQVLMCAIDDMTDDEIADQLGISSHAVNMRWRTIFEPIDEHPEAAKTLL